MREIPSRWALPGAFDAIALFSISYDGESIVDLGNEVYNSKKNHTLDVSWYQKEQRLSLELIYRCGLRSDEAIIDVGGDSSLLVDYFCKEGFTNVSVLDISGNALASARKMLGDAPKGIEWFEADM